MNKRNNRGGFSKTHQTCPCPRQERKCFSIFADDSGSGYCFACSQVIRGSHQKPHADLTPVTKTLLQRQKYVSTSTVLESTGTVIDFVSTFSYIEGYREALSSYQEHRAVGKRHIEAYTISGYRAISESRMPEMKEHLRKLPSFLQQFVITTGVPEVLRNFHVGFHTSGEIVFWIADNNGRVCNGQVVSYDGLSRSKTRPVRYMYRTSDGYPVNAFFGSEQLQNGFLSWTQKPFTPLTLVVIVESPKSALLGSLLHPSAIWLASCGASGVTAAKALALRGREVRVLFDNDAAGHEGAVSAKNVLIEAGAFAQIVTPNDFFGGDRPEGWDIGDEALRVIGDLP